MESLKEMIVRHMKTNSYRPLTKDELVQSIQVDDTERKSVEKLMEELENEGRIMKTRKNKYGIPEKMGFMTGVFKGHWKGFGFVDSLEDDMPSAFVSPRDMGGALHMDRVLVRVLSPAENGRQADGEVVKVLHRGLEEIPGILEKRKKFGFVVPDDPRILTDIFIPGDGIRKIPNGHRVVCRITGWDSRQRNPEGQIVQVLGDPNNPETDMTAIIIKHGLRDVFPKGVIIESKSLKQSVTDEMLKNRLDLRDQNIFTIDGADAKDLDDAISVESLQDGLIRLGVHIADVAHYVSRNCKIDEEAYTRGTSVYLVDRVLPMLPEALSNGICSLNPHEDRLTLSVFMDVDENGTVTDYRIKESVIRSSHRLVYDAVSEYLENSTEPEGWNSTLKADLTILNTLYQRLHKRRHKRGAIDFDFPEAKVVLDNEGFPVSIEVEERRTANKIIEECMLVCNETIAEHGYWKEQPFVYRVHEEPDEEKMKELEVLIHNLGYGKRITGQTIRPGVIQKLLESMTGKQESHVINTVTLRSMKKARYTAVHESHFGLAAEYYTHFTSPIRRYPDLMVHRIIKEMLTNDVIHDEAKEKKEKNWLESATEHVSQRERVAEEAERDSVNLKKVAYMTERIGEEYSGTVVGITSFGFFVQLPNTVEGLVRLSDLEDDYYVFDQQRMQLMGERTRKRVRIGDNVLIRVEAVSKSRGEIDFSLVELVEINESSGSASSIIKTQ